jgi:predicted enzyme related to lactoylglutathione lyase
MSERPFLGLRTVIYHVSDLAAARAWYEKVLGTAPYFDQPYYVGFHVGGYELGLDPDPASGAPGRGGAVPYLGVTDAEAALQRLLGLGAGLVSGVQDVGEGIRVAVVEDPEGNLLGIIENPGFKAEEPGPNP